MLTKIQESYYFFLIILDAARIILARTKRRLLDMLDIFVAVIKLLVDVKTLKNKFYAILLIGCTIPVTLIEGDATTTVLAVLITVPMFFSKKNWIY